MTTSTTEEPMEVGLNEALQPLQLAAPSKHKPKIANFPLPRELRDEIYGYLLDANRVRDNSKPFPSYKFHMGITGVNKVIRDEVLEYLDAQTGLVMVRLTGLGMHKAVLDYRVPHIFFPHGQFNRYHTGILKVAPTKVSVRWAPSPLDAIAKSTSRLPDGYEKYECVLLMVQQDLPALFHVLWSQCQWILPDAIYITSARGSPVQVRDDVLRRKQNKTEPPSISLVCQGALHGNRVKQQAQQQILQAIRNAVGCGYNFQLGGLDDTALAQKTINATRPQIISTAAQQWETLDMVLDAQRRGDRCALNGMVEQALNHYDFIMTYIMKDATIWPCEGPQTIRPKDAPSVSHWELIFLDLLMSSTWLKVRNGDKEAIDDAIMFVLRNISLAGQLEDEAVIAKFQHMMIHSNFRIQPGQDFAALIVKFAELEGRTKDEYLKHDLPIYIDTLVQLSQLDDDGINAFDFDETKLSCYSMPIRTFDFFTSHTPPLTTRPTRFQGWQDTEHLATLSIEDKKKIRDKQIKLGFRVSEF